jgi:hypothetical protein
MKAESSQMKVCYQSHLFELLKGLKAKAKSQKLQSRGLTSNHRLQVRSFKAKEGLVAQVVRALH